MVEAMLRDVGFREVRVHGRPHYPLPRTPRLWLEQLRAGRSKVPRRLPRMVFHAWR